MLLVMVVALVILPFLPTMAGENMAVQTAKRKARFRLLPQYKPRFQLLYEPASGNRKARCLPFRAFLARGGDFYIPGIAKVNNADDRLDRLSYRAGHIALRRSAVCCGWR